MKSIGYTLPKGVISCMAAALMAVLPAEACGPRFSVIPTPRFFVWPVGAGSEALLEREENLRLWQQITSPTIPASDISKVLYVDECYDPQGNPDNLFYAYIRSANDQEVKQFLHVAKMLECRRKKMASPWYYPESKNDETEDFSDIIDLCRAYRGTRLKDRYALQLVRALFAARNYAECVDSYERCFGPIPDGNLMKRMAMRYVAGCWSRLGDADRADRFFALSGDVESVSRPDAVAYVAELNPNCAALMARICQYANDSARFCAVKPVAERVLRSGKVRHRGDWEFYLAYEAGEFHGNYVAASHHMARAMRSQFSSPGFRDHARAYRMKVDAALGRSGELLSDLRWMEDKMKEWPEAEEWSRMLQNIVYMNWVPTLWRQREYATAVLLCGYADNIFACKRRYTCLPSGRFWYPLDGFNYRAPDTELVSITLDEMRRSSERNNEVDYSVLSFRLMNTLTSSQLISVKHSIAADRPLYRHLRRYARTDAPYIDEIIGTLALREERYARAVRYLAGVPLHYLATLNIYKKGHLNANPFCLQPSMWHVFDSIASPLRAKYHFACRMHHYQKLMHHGRTPNERGLARLKYAIARRNSLEGCWALTQYWRGCVPQLFTPEYDAMDLCLVNRFPELYDYETTVGCEATQTVFGREVKAAMAMLTTDAARAEAEHMLFHLKTIIRRYPYTPAAREVKSSCDRWRHWI